MMLREGKDLNAEIQRLKEFRNPRYVDCSQSCILYFINLCCPILVLFEVLAVQK